MTQTEIYMKKYNMTKEEAEELIAADKEIDRTNVKSDGPRHYEKSDKPRKPREKVIDTEKVAIMKQLAEIFIIENLEAEKGTADILINGISFGIKVVRHRPKKEG